MLSLVIDIEAYPEFINLVSVVRILEREDKAPGQYNFRADLGVQYKFISERFRSVIHVDENDKTLSIERAGHGGAVRDLQNSWKFIELGDGSTLIDFSLNVRLKAPPLEYLIRQKFDKATLHIVDLFEDRAGQLYDKVGENEYDFSSEQGQLIS